MATVYGYIRVSRIGEHGENSVEDQEQVIEQFAKRSGYSISRFFNERSVSGGMPLSSRPMAKRMFDALEKGDVVVVASFSRLFRSVLDARNSLRLFKKLGVSVYAVDLGEAITGDSLYHTLTIVTDAFAPTEAEYHAQKIREAKANLREEGKFQGGKIDFGYRVADDGKLIEDEHGQEALRLMKKLRKSGMSYRAISDEIEKKFRKYDLKISHEGIRRILARNS